MKSEETRLRDLDSQRVSRRRHLMALGSSLAFHVGVLAAMVFLLPSLRPVALPSYYVLAYFDAPAGLSGSSGGPLSSDVGPRPSTTPPKPATIVPVVHRKRKALTRHADHLDFDQTNHDEAAVASGRPASATGLILPGLAGQGSASSESSKTDSNQAGTSDGGQVASLGGSGQGDAAGSGDGGAHAEYGAEPAPFYPISARRSNEQGEVILRVLVAADGAVKHVEVSQSSGFEQLDDSAIETVSHKWRFEPAHRLGVRVESWVIVPIRFRLSAANAS